MPEIVEVKKYVDFINHYLHNNTIIQVKIIGGRYKKHGPFQGYKHLIKSLPISNVKAYSKGKFIYIMMNDLVLFNTLGLSGGWLYYSPKTKKYTHPDMIEFLNVKDVDKYLQNSINHVNIEFKLKKGILCFFDTLSYGTMKVGTTEELNTKLNMLGPDIFNMSLKEFNDRLKQNKNLNKKIGIVLVDQKTIAGIGNYIRSDCLWLAKLSPHNLVKNLDDTDIRKLYKSIISIIWSEYNYNYAVKNKIISKRYKRPIDYERDFFVYFEEKDVYGNKVKKEEMYEGTKKRFIYWCPKLQI
jgi:formamidopyrimidine-DNA glycosylase